MLLRLLEKLPTNTCINKAVLVAGWATVGTNPEYTGFRSLLAKDPFDWAKIKKSARRFYFIYSDNDPYECGKENGEIFQKHLGGELIIMPGQKHFNLEKGPEYKKFPLVLELVEDIRKR